MDRDNRSATLVEGVGDIEDGHGQGDGGEEGCFSEEHARANATTETEAGTARVALNFLARAGDEALRIELERLGIDIGIVQDTPGRSR